MKDGGPAFPVEETADMNDKEGMSLQKWYAGKAIALFPLSLEDIQGLHVGRMPDHRFVAKFCFDLADKMIAECDRRANE